MQRQPSLPPTPGTRPGHPSPRPTFSTRALFSTNEPSTALNSKYLVTSVWISTLTRLPLAWSPRREKGEKSACWGRQGEWGHRAVVHRVWPPPRAGRLGEGGSRRSLHPNNRAHTLTTTRACLILAHPACTRSHHDELWNQVHVVVAAGTQLGWGLLSRPEPLIELRGRPGVGGATSGTEEARGRASATVAGTPCPCMQGDQHSRALPGSD